MRGTCLSTLLEICYNYIRKDGECEFLCLTAKCVSDSPTYELCLLLANMQDVGVGERAGYR